jgi:hypothetical protein
MDLGFSALGRAIDLIAEAATAAAAAGIALPPALCGSRFASPPTPDLDTMTDMDTTMTRVGTAEKKNSAKRYAAGYLDTYKALDLAAIKQLATTEVAGSPRNHVVVARGWCGRRGAEGVVRGRAIAFLCVWVATGGVRKPQGTRSVDSCLKSGGKCICSI